MRIRIRFLKLLTGLPCFIAQGTPDTPVASLSPVSDSLKPLCPSSGFNEPKLLTPAEKQDLETRLGDFLVFLRRLIATGPMGNYLCRYQWINLLMSFISCKPCEDVDLFLKLGRESVESVESPSPSTSSSHDGSFLPNSEFSLSPIGKDIYKNILLTPGIRPRLLTVQLLESVLRLATNNEGSDFKEQVCFHSFFLSF